MDMSARVNELNLGVSMLVFVSCCDVITTIKASDLIDRRMYYGPIESARRNQSTAKIRGKKQTFFLQNREKN